VARRANHSSVFEVSNDFARILNGLMTNRRLTRVALSRASGRAESTINRLLVGATPPTAELLQDIAPALQMAVADLLVIADLPVEYDASRPGPWKATSGIGSLVAAASWLMPEQVEQVTALARELKAQNA
jgi:hypothetical protein